MVCDVHLEGVPGENLLQLRGSNANSKIFCRRKGTGIQTSVRMFGNSNSSAEKLRLIRGREKQ